MDKIPEVSIVIPIHDMQGGAEFLWRSVNALTEQTHQDFEIIITKAGKMAENTNAGIKKARGKYIKVLYLDDYLSDPESLERMVVAMNAGANWVMCGTDDNPTPKWTEDIETGNNKLGSPSALMIRNKKPLMFDVRMSWLLDCDYYKRMFKELGPPTILKGSWVKIGKGPHQMTHILTDEEKLLEHNYLIKKHV